MSEKIGWEQKLANRNYSFETKIDKFIANTENKIMAVLKDAINEVVEEAQIPYDKDKGGGGKMHVDTGFLRFSGVSALNKIPSGPSKRDPKKRYIWESDVPLTLSKMTKDDTFYFGWTANYAKYREAYDGFLESAVQNWQKHINNAVRKLKK